jgi:glycosyltransferase involved in cell wall biosynthesis
MVPTISLCMICKNEEATLGRCLDTVRGLVDEIVVVDTGSTDETKQVAARYGCKVYDFEWMDDFAAARNYAFSKATCDFILWLDADDILLPEDQQRFAQLKAAFDLTVDVVTMPYHYPADEHGYAGLKWIRERLVRRTNGYRWVGAIHEYLEAYGKIATSDVVITHWPEHTSSDRNLRIYEQRWDSRMEFAPRDLYYFANELLDHSQWTRAREFYLRFLDTQGGWVEDVIAAHGKISDCYFNEGQVDEAIIWALKSFQYDTPRAEQCCRLGYYFLTQDRIREAAYWYTVAVEAELPEGHTAITLSQCSTWLPHLQLCVCYDRLGDYESAYKHNEIALAFCPTDERMLANKKYLATRRVEKFQVT